MLKLLEKFFTKTLSFSRLHKKALMLATDVILLPSALYLAFTLRFSEFHINYLIDNLPMYFVITFLSIAIFYSVGAYRTVIRFISLNFVVKIIKGLAFITIIFFALISFFYLDIPRSIPILFALLAMIFVLFTRILVFVYYKQHFLVKNNRIGVAIYGAGFAGVQLASALEKGKEFHVQAFFDDDANLARSNVQGIIVYPPKKITEVVQKHQIQKILLAIPSASDTDRLRILTNIYNLNLSISVDTVPSMPEIVTGLAKIDKLRKIDITDLLGRGEVTAKADLLSKCIENKAVMVTGAGGTIGSELCRQIVRLKPQKLVLFELNEYALYAIEKDLQDIQKSLNLNIKIYPVLGSITDATRLENTLKHFGIKTVYHAAAYKHVPMVEYNIFQGINNNIFGTKILADTAIKAGVERFILISTDKAVRPTNIMGATKRSAELVLQDLALSQSKTCFAMVRFGNVLGSSGSVVPLFQKQIQAGGPVTVTHKDIIRYFMTISEAALLVIQAGSMAEGGEVFLLDMGKPVRIYDLAKKMINLSGFSLKDENNPNGDIEISFTGLRPGEKLYEELLIGDDNSPTSHPKIMRGMEEAKSTDILEKNLDLITQANLTNDYEMALDALFDLVEGFKHSKNIEDCFTWE